LFLCQPHSPSWQAASPYWASWAGAGSVLPDSGQNKNLSPPFSPPLNCAASLSHGDCAADRLLC
jgi:hypothetical protein